MAEKKELNPSPKFPSGDYPELSPNPNQVDGLVNKTGEKPNTQFVNLPKEQEKRCLTVSEVIELILKYAPKGDTLPEVTSLDNEKVLEVIAGAWGKGGKKVNVIDAPSSTTLTDEEVELFKNGIFINGLYLGLKNPIILPSGESAGNYLGWFIAGDGVNITLAYIGTYMINKTSKVISIKNKLLTYQFANSTLEIKNVSAINEKEFPSYPTNTGTFTLKCVDGVLKWVQDV